MNAFNEPNAVGYNAAGMKRAEVAAVQNQLQHVRSFVEPSEGAGDRDWASSPYPGLASTKFRLVHWPYVSAIIGRPERLPGPTLHTHARAWCGPTGAHPAVGFGARQAGCCGGSGGCGGSGAGGGAPGQVCGRQAAGQGAPSPPLLFDAPTRKCGGTTKARAKGLVQGTGLYPLPCWLSVGPRVEH